MRLLRGWSTATVLLFVILALGAGLRILLALITPPLYAPDEAGHLLYVHEVAVHFSFPVQSRDGIWANASGANEFYQPPLYYLLAAGPYRLLLHAGVAAVYGLRLLNVALGMAGVYLIYRIARMMFLEQRSVALTGAALVALLPTAAGESASVGNDPLAYLLDFLVTWLLLRTLRDRRCSPPTAIAIGALTAAALYTKTSAVLLLPSIAAWAWLMQRRQVPHWRGAAIALTLAVLAVAPWWLLRDLPAYGDLLGIDIGWRRDLGPAPFVLAVKALYYLAWSFWIAFGRTYDVHAEHPLAFALTLISVALAWRAVRLWITGKLTSLQATMATLLTLQLALALGAAIKYGVQFGFTQGRYIYPALPALAVGLGVAASSRKPPRVLWAPLGMIAVMGAACVVVVASDLVPAYRQVTVDVQVGVPMQPGHTGDYASWVTRRVAPIH